MKANGPVIGGCGVAGCADDDNWCGFYGGNFICGAGEFVFGWWCQEFAGDICVGKVWAKDWSNVAKSLGI